MQNFKKFYNKSTPIKRNIEMVNKLYDKGHTIKIFTARYMGRSNENQVLAKKRFKLTKIQLKQWNVKYHKLILGKLHMI